MKERNRSARRSTWLERLALLALTAAVLAAAPAGAQEASSAQGTGGASGAAAPFVQVPGVYRQRIDGLQVTALFDGVLFIPVRDLMNIDPARAQALLDADDVPQTPQGAQTAVNAYLVRRGAELLLVDTGAGTCFGPTLGQVQANLRAAGVRPEDVNDVLLTHAHPDHICGLLSTDGAPAFPNATVWLARADAAYWLSDSARKRAPKALQPLFDMAQRAIAPYRDTGRFKAFDAQDTPPAGVQAVPSPGHTPGHTSWRITGLTDRGALLV